MKVYAIKNGKNLYWFGEDAFFNIYDGSFAPFDKKIIMFDSEDLAEEAINRNGLYGCTIVPITIYEGDPLELSCEELVSRDGCSIIPEDESLESYMEEYIQQAKEMKENDAR